MKTLIAVLGLTLTATAAHAQDRAEGHAPQAHGSAREYGGGHIPSHGPAAIRAPRAPAPRSAPPQSAPDRPAFRDRPEHPEAPHVHSRTDAWVGHGSGRGDEHYHLDHPWEHGHFPGRVGPRHVWRLHGG